MSVPIRLSVDRQNRTLVVFQGSVANLPPLFQSNTQAFIIMVVDQDPSNPLGGYVLADLNGVGLRMAIGAKPQGTTGPTPATVETGWIWDATNKWYTGTLALNTAAIDTLLGASDTVQAYIEINTTEATGRTTILQKTFTLNAVVDELGSIVPTPTDQYLTKSECLQLFAKLVGLPGERIRLIDPNGLYARELGCDVDGSSIDNDITL